MNNCVKNDRVLFVSAVSAVSAVIRRAEECDCFQYLQRISSGS